MDRDAALSTIKQVASEVLSVDTDAVTEQARFKEDLDADSLDLVELVEAIEAEFAIRIGDDELIEITTVGEAFSLVAAKVA